MLLEEYRHRRLDDTTEAAADATTPESPSLPRAKGKRREFLRDYLRWLRPHRYAAGVFFLLALIVAGLDLIEPLFMRFIIDHVLMNRALDTAARLIRPQPA